MTIDVTAINISEAEALGLVRVACTSFPGNFETGIAPSHHTTHDSPRGGFRVFWATPEAVEASGWRWREGRQTSSEHLRRCRIASYPAI